MEFSFKDLLRNIVETDSNGKNTVIYDDHGNPNVMVRIPKFNMDSWGIDGLSGVHPAFIVHGREIPEIYISKYNCTTEAAGGVYSSFHNATPTADFGRWRDAYDNICRKGRGWHMLTLAEHSAVSMQAAMRDNKVSKFGISPTKKLAGGPLYGADQSNGNSDTDQVPYPRYASTGYNHDGTRNGITLFGGCLWDALSGVKTINGKLYVHGEDGTAMNNFDSPDVKGEGGKGWLDTGIWVNNVNGVATYAKSYNNVAQPAPGDGTNSFIGRLITAFNAMGGQNIPPSYFKPLGLQYTSLMVGHEFGLKATACGQYEMFNVGEVHAVKGGSYGSGSGDAKSAETSLFTIAFMHTETAVAVTSWSCGVRVAYIPY